MVKWLFQNVYHISKCTAHTFLTNLTKLELYFNFRYLVSQDGCTAEFVHLNCKINQWKSK